VSETKIIKIADIILIAAFLIFACAFYFIFDLSSNDSDMAVIKLNGIIYAEVSLPVREKKEIEIYFNDGTLSNIVRINDNTARMIYAVCPDKRCMRQDGSYFIVCLPNRVTVEITGGGKHEFDVVI